MDTEQNGRTENETLIYEYILNKLDRLEEGCFWNKEWDFRFGTKQTPDFYVFYAAVEYKGSPDDRLSRTTTSLIEILIATDENIDAVASQIKKLMSKDDKKPEIIVAIRADRPQVDTWTLFSNEARHLTRNDYRHSTRNDGDIEFDAFGGDFHWFFEDVYADCEGIYEQVAA